MPYLFWSNSYAVLAGIDVNLIIFMSAEIASSTKAYPHLKQQNFLFQWSAKGDAHYN